MRYLELRVTRQEKGLKLREFLVNHLKISGRQAKALLDAHNVSVNGRRVWMAGHLLVGGETIGVASEAPESTDAAPSPAASEAPIRVLFEDPDYLVIDKPANISTNGPESVEERLRNERQEPGLTAVHRLDRDTTGCVMIARHEKAFNDAVEAFRAHAVSKTYRAIVVGRLHVRNKVIEAPVEGLTAKTIITTLSATTAATYLAVETLTGRTHQVRVHLSGIQHPVIGDRQYGPPRGLTAAMMRIQRQMLHASDLHFTHPRTKKLVKVHTRLPDDFQACLKAFSLREAK